MSRTQEWIKRQYPDAPRPHLTNVVCIATPSTFTTLKITGTPCGCRIAYNALNNEATIEYCSVHLSAFALKTTVRDLLTRAPTDKRIEVQARRVLEQTEAGGAF